MSVTAAVVIVVAVAVVVAVVVAAAGGSVVAGAVARSVAARAAGLAYPNPISSWVSMGLLLAHDTEISVHIHGRPNKVRGSAPPKMHF